PGGRPPAIARARRARASAHVAPLTRRPIGPIPRSQPRGSRTTTPARPAVPGPRPRDRRAPRGAPAGPDPARRLLGPARRRDRQAPVRPAAAGRGGLPP